MFCELLCENVLGFCSSVFGFSQKLVFGVFLFKTVGFVQVVFNGFSLLQNSAKTTKNHLESLLVLSGPSSSSSYHPSHPNLGKIDPCSFGVFVCPPENSFVFPVFFWSFPKTSKDPCFPLKLVRFFLVLGVFKIKWLIALESA